MDTFELFNNGKLALPKKGDGFCGGWMVKASDI